MSVCPSVRLSHEFYSEAAGAIVTKFGEKMVCEPLHVPRAALFWVSFKGSSLYMGKEGATVFFTQYGHDGYQIKVLKMILLVILCEK